MSETETLKERLRRLCAEREARRCHWCHMVDWCGREGAYPAPCARERDDR